MTRVAVVLFGAVALLWQPRPDARSQPSVTGTIRGRVVAAATGDPIRNARVSITDDHERPPLLSDADGRFAFLALPAGTFTLTVSKPGFAKTTFGARAPGEAGMPIRVAGGAVIDDVIVALPRGAAIAGLVVDDTGEPVPGASVMVERAGARSGATPAVPVVGLTDEAGRYRIGSLGAGPVLVSIFAVARSVVMLPGGGIMSGGNDLGQRIYYPGGLKAERGEPVLLQAGNEQPGVDFVTPANVPIGPRVRPAPSGATVVSGRIISAEGRALPGAQISLQASGSTEARMRQTVSDADGSYQFVLPRSSSGTFRMLVTRTGYLPAWYGQRDPRDLPEEIVVVAGDVKANLNVALALPAVIAGRIFDEHGDPVEGALVQTSFVRFVDGQRRLIAIPATTRPTDDLGRYRVSRLLAGEYIVSAVVGQIVGTEVAVDLPGYAVTYYPGTPSATEGQLIALGGSQELSGVDFSLVRTRTARVTGQAFDAAGEPVGGGLMLTPSRRSGVVAPVALGAHIERDGRFEFTNVPPGDYVLQVSRHRHGSWNEGETASQFVTVTGGDITGLEIRASSGSTVTGHFVVDGDASVTPNQLLLVAVPLDPDLTVMGAGPPARALIRNDLGFELEGLQGPRRLRLLGVPSGFALKAIVLNGSDVTDATLPFGRRDQSLEGVEVVLTTHISEISGSVADARGQPFNTGMVVAFALDPWLRDPRSRFVGTAAADRDARYRLQGLPPGEYYVAALDRRRAMDIEDPNFLESLVPHATRVTLGEGVHVSLPLRAR